MYRLKCNDIVIITSFCMKQIHEINSKTDYSLVQASMTSLSSLWTVILVSSLALGSSPSWYYVTGNIRI